MSVPARANGKPVADLTVAPPRSGRQVPSTTPLTIKPISRVVTAGQVVEVGSGNFELHFSSSSSTIVRQVVDGKLDTGGMRPGRYMLVARSGTQIVPAGRLVVS